MVSELEQLRRRIDSLTETLDRQGLILIEDAIKACQETRRVLDALGKNLADLPLGEAEILSAGLGCGIAQVDSAMGEPPEYGTTLGHMGYSNIRDRLRVAVAIAANTLNEINELRSRT